MRDILGYCKECGSAVYEIDKIPNYEVYECSKCNHPHSKSELWDVPPDYISNIKYP
jgi:DNA-directed RNA polymerase subunit M/transcription elongation factor TFIIS